MKRLLKIFIAFAILVGGGCQFSFAQQDMQFSQFMYNGLVYNPAFAGVSGSFSATLFYRNQWTGFAGAPVSQSLIASLPIPDKKISAGITVLNDQAGALRFWTLAASGAYKIEFEKNLLSIGLNVGMRQLILDASTLETQSGSSTQISGSAIQAPVVPDFGVGFLFKDKEDKFYLGLSGLHLFPAKIAFTSNANDARFRQQFYFNAGYKYNLSPDFKLIPSTLVKYVIGAPMQIDFNTTFLFQEKFWFGAAYRSSDAFTINLGIQADKLISGFTPRIKIGYAFDATVARLPSYNQFGSHEVFVSYEVGFAEKVHIPKFKKLE